MTRSDAAPLIKSKAFRIAVAFDWLCVMVSVGLAYFTEQPVWAVAPILLGGLVIMVVIFRFQKSASATPQGVASNPKIVE